MAGPTLVLAILTYYLSEPQFPLVRNGDNRTYFAELFWGLHENSILNAINGIAIAVAVVILWLFFCTQISFCV